MTDEALLAACKNALDITWTDADEDIKIAGLIKRGKTYIDRIAGEKMTYAEEGLETALLFNYVMYGRAGLTNQFEENYASDLLALQLDRRMARADQESTGV